MKKFVNYENLRSFAYSNDKICRKPVRGVVVNFFGLGDMSRFDEDTGDGKFFAENGLIYLLPYTNPWAWMNRQAVAFTDEIIEVIMKQYSLSDNIPIISMGGSMGGLSALVYTRYGAKTPVACVTNCPVCDLPYHFTERPDLPRTLYSAFFDYEGTLDEALRLNSPLHLAAEMPRIDYTVFHCTADKAVNKEKHSDRFVKAMTDAGQNVTYYAVPDRGHGDLTPEMWELYKKCSLDAADKFTGVCGDSSR